jgi:hypothetical protein
MGSTRQPYEKVSRVTKILQSMIRKSGNRFSEKIMLIEPYDGARKGVAGWKE